MRVLDRLLPRAPKSPWASVAPPRRERSDGPTILCATSVGGHEIARTIDSLVASALWIRGANPVALLCDGILPACELCTYVAFEDDVTEFARHGPERKLCRSCFAAGSRMYAPLPFDVRRYREFVSSDEIAKARAYAETLAVEEWFALEENGLKLGEQVRAATMRFYGKADLSTEPAALLETTVRRYGAGALLTAAVATRVFEEIRPEVLVCHHGLYVPQGVLGEVARRDGVRVVNWGPTYRDRTVIYSHGDTYHRTLISEPVEVWDEPLSADRETALLTFLAERRRGKGDWTWITPEAALRPNVQEGEEVRRWLELDPEKPVFGLLTNVLWDAQLYYEGQAFTDMLEWLWTTIDYFAAHPELQLVVRIHPHEVKAGNRQPVSDEIARRYPELPANVRVVPYDSPINTYVLMQLCQVALIYGTKTGVELTPLGQPVVVAAEAWIRGKDLTIDPETKSAYLEVLEEITAIQPLDELTVDRARRYAFHYFFRRMIPLSSLEPGSDDVRLTVRSLDDLRPGKDPGLDVICNGILYGEPFVFDA